VSEKIINRILLTNDDGIDAAGIVLLEKAASQFANEVWIVAPAVDKSGVANSISLREPLRISKRGEHKYAVYGTPADCVAFAINQVMKDTPPDLILSGINSGSNLGFETLLSGTVGAAMTGMLLGVPSIALSQYEQADKRVDWSCAENYIISTLTQLLSLTWSKQVCLSVNFPNVAPDKVKGLKVTTQGIGNVKNINATKTTDPHGEDYYWIRIQDGELDKPDHSELAVVEQGYISVTPLTYERTCQNEYRRLTKLVMDN
jgi:5'-nucleotidase